MEDGLWQAEGHKGVILRVQRQPDGSAIFGTFHKDEGPMYGMHLSSAATMDLLAYLMNQPSGAPS